MKYDQKSEMEFKAKMQRAIYIPLLLGSVLMWFYVYVFIPPTLFIEKRMEFYVVLSLGIALFIVQSAIFIPLSIKKRISTICDGIEEINKNPGDFTPTERTTLASSIIKQPKNIAWFSVFSNVASNLILLLCIMIFFRDDETQPLFLIVPFLISAATTGIFVFDSLLKICSMASKTITIGDLDEEEIAKEKYFGTSIFRNFCFHLVFPCLALILTIVSLLLLEMIKSSLNLSSTCILLVTMLIYMVLLANNYKNLSLVEIHKVNKALDEISSKERELEINNAGNESNAEENAPHLLFDLNLDISYTPFLINRLITEMEKDSSESNNAVQKIVSLTQKLDNDIKKANEQLSSQGETIASAISAMNEIEEYMAQIESQVSEVGITSNTMLLTINESSEILEKNMEKIAEITQSNIETISGIKELSEQIENVWSVIATIDSITEKTRIIAFNAEIETSTLGEAGENFHIVANEIRRLADSITDSTLSIKKKITSIQHASDNLVITSEGGTEKIREESELFTNLEEKFEEIKLSGHVTDESASIISQFLQNQKDSFKELSYLLRDLNANFLYFKKRAADMISTNQLIQAIATNAINADGQNTYNGDESDTNGGEKNED